MIFGNFFKGKRILVTGNTGFKGSWLAIWLLELGAQVNGYSLAPKTEFDNFVVSKLSNKMDTIIADIRDYEKILKVFKEVKPQIVFHLAAQSLVKQSYLNPIETLNTNIIGTANVLEAIRLTDSVEIAVMITSDKCYENMESRKGYRESDRLGGHDPYSASKGCCELVISSYGNSFLHPEKYSKHGKSLASARAGNVIGGGDWAQDRIVPDCIRSLEKNEPAEIRNPDSVRPWQHVLEPVGGYLTLGYKMSQNPTRYCEAWNFGPDAEALITVSQLTDKLISYYGKGSWVKVAGTEKQHETGYLALDCSKAKQELGWKPLLNIDEAIELTSSWYKHYHEYDDCYLLAKEQIDHYLRKVDQPKSQVAL